MSDDLTLSPETEKLLEERSRKGCVSCAYILQDWKSHGKLTGFPVSPAGDDTFPVDAKEAHIRYEKERDDNR